MNLLCRKNMDQASGKCISGKQMYLPRFISDTLFTEGKWYMKWALLIGKNSTSPIKSWTQLLQSSYELSEILYAQSAWI